MTPTELGAIGIAVFAAFYSLRIFQKTTAALGLLSVVLLGTTGLLGRVLSDVTGFVERVFGHLGATVFGSAGAAFFAVVIYLIIRYSHGMHPRHSAGQIHAWLGVALGALIVTGVAGIPQLGALHSGIVSAVTAVTGG